MIVEWEPDRRNLGAEIAFGDDPHYELSATTDGFRVEMGSLTIEMDAESLAQAKVFAEVALEWVWTLDAKLAEADRIQRAAGARVPSVRPDRTLYMDETTVPVKWARDPECRLCLAGLVVDPHQFMTKQVCSCVKAVL